MIVERVNYVIKGHPKQDFSDYFTPSCAVNEDHLEFVAEEIAEYQYQENPCDPDDFKFEIGVRYNGVEKWFKVNAEVDVIFNSTEIS